MWCRGRRSRFIVISADAVSDNDNDDDGEEVEKGRQGRRPAQDDCRCMYIIIIIINIMLYYGTCIYARNNTTAAASVSRGSQIRRSRVPPPPLFDLRLFASSLNLYPRAAPRSYNEWTNRSLL